MKLDIACGQRKQDGHVGIDLAGNADIVHDLNRYPWPVKDNDAESVFCSHYVEHIPLDVKRAGKTVDGLIAFMEELYRVVAPGGLVEIHHPYCKSERAFWDPTHRRFIATMTWYYFNREWREAQGLDHYPISCDFEVVNIAANGIPDDIAARDEEAKLRLMHRSWDGIADLQVVLRSLKPTRAARRSRAKAKA